jgi:outer membrane lipoprotein SlyB
MRSSSYSPPRNERAYDDDSRRRRRSRSRSRSRSSSSDGSKTQRLAATLIGGLVGGFAGNQFRKYDTAATITGAVLGGIASREIADKIGGKKEDRKDKRQGEQEAWEREYGDGRRKSGDDDRRRSSRR